MQNSYRILGTSVYGPKVNVVGTIHKNSYKSILLRREDIYDKGRKMFGIPYDLFICLKSHPFTLLNIVIPLYREGVLLTRLKSLVDNGKIIQKDHQNFIMQPETLWEFRIKDKLGKQLTLFK